MAGEKHVVKIDFSKLDEKKKASISRSVSNRGFSDKKVASSVILDLEDVSNAEELLNLTQLVDLCYKHKAEVSEFFGRDMILSDLSYIWDVFERHDLPKQFSDEERQKLVKISKYYAGKVKEEEKK
jgi:hypothetical protein